jgi:hypothetical protein
MKTQLDHLAILAVLAIALAGILASLVPSRSAAGRTSPEPAPQEKENPYASTAIGAVIDANGGRLPATGKELQEALQKLGEFVQLPVPFSAVDLNSGLSHPRVVIAMRLISQTPPAHLPTPHLPPPPPPRDSGGWGGGGGGGGGAGGVRTQVPEFNPLGGIATNKPNLEGRLFLAANMVVDVPFQNPHVKTIEFISWNSRRMKFDFGVIEGIGESPELKILDGARCFSCHKNKGPILGTGPWSNTTHNNLVRGMSKSLFAFEPKDLLNAVANLDPILRNDIDGMMLLTPAAQEVDDAVRFGADILRNREMFRVLARTQEGRKTIVLLLTAIAEAGPIDKIDKRLQIDINSHYLVSFIGDAVALQKATPSSMLIDYSPSGSMGKTIGTHTTWGGSTLQVNNYDEARAAGHNGMISERLPSNPKAFVKQPIRAPNQPAQLVSALMLARTIGLTDADRKFLAEALSSSTQKGGGTPMTAATLARRIFTGSTFADVVSNGDIPDRDDFKDRFAAGLVEVQQEIPKVLQLGRDQYTSGPYRDSLGGDLKKEIEVVPTTACLRCHDIGNAGKTSTLSPIPLLAFDPFDKAGREAWIKTTDRKRKSAVLTRMIRRLVTDKDMPPEDAAEYELFRVKDTTAFNEAKSFLEAELKKVKGN